MYTPSPIRDQQTAFGAELAEVSRHQRLVIYTGAGLSYASPTDMPNGAEVARRCYTRLVESLGETALANANTDILTSVADEVANHASDDLVKHAAANVAPFTSASSNFSHEVIAILILEGFVEAITTNWDDCIERAAPQGERILPVVSDQDRQEISSPPLLKVHGCATRPATILITTQELSNPPLWVRGVVSDRLADSVLIFVGIGDVAEYVEHRIQEAKQTIASDASVYVVAPDICQHWESTPWNVIFPNLPNSRRICKTADDFFDALAAAYIRSRLRYISDALQNEAHLANAFGATRAALEASTSIELLRWLRCCSVPRERGHSVTQKSAFSYSLVAIGMLAHGGTISLLEGGRVVIDQSTYEVLVAAKPGSTAALS